MMSDDIQPLISGLSVCRYAVHFCYASSCASSCSPNPEERVPQFALIPEASFCTPPSARSAARPITQPTASRPAARPAQQHQKAAVVTGATHSGTTTVPVAATHDGALHFTCTCDMTGCRSAKSSGAAKVRYTKGRL